MNRYQELCVLATQYSKQFHEHADLCRNLASQLIQEYAAYLSCPLESIEQVELDRTLRPTERNASLSQRVRVITDPEGFVHFAWHVNFDAGSYLYAAKELVTFGLRVAPGGGAVIREDKDFSIESQEHQTWQPFLEYLCRQSHEGFSVPYGERHSRIGFHDPQ